MMLQNLQRTLVQVTCAAQTVRVEARPRPPINCHREIAADAEMGFAASGTIVKLPYLSMRVLQSETVDR